MAKALDDNTWRGPQPWEDGSRLTCAGWALSYQVLSLNRSVARVQVSPDFMGFMGGLHVNDSRMSMAGVTLTILRQTPFICFLWTPEERDSCPQSEVNRPQVQIHMPRVVGHREGPMSL